VKLIRECVVDTPTHRAICHPWATFLDRLLGERCLVTGERVFTVDRADHEHFEHPGEGACADA
jgi:hypothetical protein